VPSAVLSLMLIMTGVAGCAHRNPGVHCAVTGASFLPASMTSDGVCALFADALTVADKSRGVSSYDVQVQLPSARVAKAILVETAQGKSRSFPEQTVSIMDSTLNEKSFVMLVDAIVGQIKTEALKD
jgi:hypothetical protein